MKNCTKHFWREKARAPVNVCPFRNRLFCTRSDIHCAKPEPKIKKVYKTYLSRVIFNTRRHFCCKQDIQNKMSISGVYKVLAQEFDVFCCTIFSTWCLDCDFKFKCINLCVFCSYLLLLPKAEICGKPGGQKQKQSN